MTAKAARTLVPAVLAAVAAFALLAIEWQRAVDVPFSDEWDWGDLIYAAHTHTLTFARLWATHNEHRIVVPNVLVVAVDAVAGWNVAREQLFSALVVVATQLFVWLLVRRSVAPERRGVTFLFATVLLYSFVQFENLFWGFQIAWFLCDLALAAAVWALASPMPPAWRLSAGIAVATIGSLTSSQGTLIWAAGLLVLVLSRRHARHLAVWCTAAVLVIALAREGATPGPSVYGSLAQPLPLAQYALTYLGAPLGLSGGEAVSRLWGIVLCLWIAALIAAGLRRRDLAAPLAPWFAFVLYAGACAAITAYGRVGFGLWQATSSRYTTIALLAWIGAAVATMILLPRDRRALVAIVPACVVLWFAGTQAYDGDRVWREHAQAMREARAALAAGDLRGAAMVYPNPRRVVQQMARMAAVDDGMFNAR